MSPLLVLGVLASSLAGLLVLNSGSLADDSADSVVLAKIGHWKVIRYGGAGNSGLCVLENGQGDDRFQIMPASDPSLPYIVVGRSKTKWKAAEALKNESERIQVTYQLDDSNDSKLAKISDVLFSFQEGANLRQTAGFKVTYALVSTTVPTSEIVGSEKRVVAEYSLAGLSDVVVWWDKPECK